MSTKYSIIAFLGFVSLILGGFLQATRMPGAGYFQGLGSGLIVCGSALLINSYMQDEKSKSNETSNKTS